MGWWHKAKVGDKIVCVKDATLINLRPMDGTPCPSVGEVCTITSVNFRPNHGVGVYFGLSEYVIGIFGRNLFRPVQPKSTDKSFEILKSILNGQPVKEDA